MIPAHWMQQVITPTWEMNVARAQVGGCWLFSDLVQEDLCRRGGRVPRRLSLEWA